jgi:hypothetical protein
MLNVRALPIHGTEPDEEIFFSLENTPIVLADIRAALPRLREELMARWPAITAVEIENRRITRRRNPHDPREILANAVLGIQIYLYTRPAQIFLEDVARAAGKKVGDAGGDRMVEIMEYVGSWIKRMVHTLPAESPGSPRKRLRQGAASSKKSKKKGRSR